MNTSNPLRKVLEAVESPTRPPLVVFDLDSTLFDVSHRTRELMRQLDLDAHFTSCFPHESRLLKDIKIYSTDYGIKDALTRSEIKAHLNFFEYVRRHWAKGFFSNDYLKHDQPYEGAVQYVQRLHREGAHIAYLTGRDLNRMGVGTRLQLEQWGFPLPGDRVQLRLKPHHSHSDVEFKCLQMAAFAKKIPDIFYFENEPSIIHEVRRTLPQIQIIFVQTTHSGRAEPPENLPSIGPSYFVKEP